MTMTIPENTAAPDFGAEVAAEQVDYPRILYVCEHCQENAPEMCGRSRDDLYVTPSGKWLCDECIDEEGVPVSDCVSPPALYPTPTVAHLQQEIQQLTEERDALRAARNTWIEIAAGHKARAEEAELDSKLAHPGDRYYTDDEELSDEDKARIDAAWEAHKAAAPVARIINDNQPGSTAIVEVLTSPPTLTVGTELFTAPQALSRRGEDGWRSIETAPKDGSIIILTNGREVFAGAWEARIKGDGFPWLLVEDVSTHQPHGCCDMEDDERIEVNGWPATAPTHWMPLPTPPVNQSEGAGLGRRALAQEGK